MDGTSRYSASTSEIKGSRCFSSFNQSHAESVLQDVSCNYQHNLPGIIEESMRNYCADRSIQLFKPGVGMKFDYCNEAYQFYNMYSWVMGFSIRCGDNYTSTKGHRAMQEYKCQRKGIVKGTKISMTRCGCKAMIRLLFNENSVWFVKLFVEEHNHPLLESCGEKKHLFSHKHIDKETKEIVRHLRENNVSLSRVNCIIGSFLGSMDKVPFIKKALRTICSEIANEALQDDVRKTMESFREMIANDPKFVFTAQLDDEDDTDFKAE